MFELVIKDSFSAAHLLDNYEGKCRKLHGHNWNVEISITGSQLDNKGILYDFSKLRLQLRTVLEYFDHKLLNELPEFKNVNPSCEQIAKVIYDKIKKLIESESCRISKVSISEGPFSTAIFYPEGELY